MGVEQARIVGAVADERLGIAAGQDRRQRVAAAATHDECGEDPLGGQRVEGHRRTAAGEPPGPARWSRNATLASIIRVLPFRAQPLLAR
jgi:hypothetical protein